MKEIYGIEQLDDFILENIENSTVICIYFGAKWCGPCNQLKKKLGESDTIEIMPKLVVCYLDIENKLNDDLVNKYNIKSLPTIVFVKLDNTKVIPVSRIEGYDFTKLKLEYDNYLN